MSYVNSVTVYPSSATITKGKWYYGAYASIASDYPECAEVEWYSNSPTIASVNKTTGYIYGVSTGTTRIYAEATDGSGKKDYITVTVTPPVSVTGVSVYPTSLTMNVGDTDYICETVCPSNATNQTVTWSSSDESVATVNTYTGKVTAKKAGTTTITACTVDGGYSASCMVSVCKLKIYQTKETFRFDENGCLAEDLEYNDISASDFNDIKNIDWSNYDFEDTAKLRDKWESLCKLTSMQPLQNVVLDMVDHFMEGTGEDYSNDTLTSKVLNHASTEEYIEAVKIKLNDVLSTYNGDISTFKYNVDERENNPFIKKLKGTNQPVFDKISDYANGLVICLHGIWGNQIEVKSYTKNGNTYSGVLTFTLYDHFGLDEADVVKFEGWHKGFGAWYILQHSQSFSGEYKPFVTVMEFDVEFSGTM